jgi:hypothetical protein
MSCSLSKMNGADKPCKTVEHCRLVHAQRLAWVSRYQLTPFSCPFLPVEEILEKADGLGPCQEPFQVVIDELSKRVECHNRYYEVRDCCSL